MDGIKEIAQFFTSGEAKEFLVQVSPLAFPLFTALVEGIMGYSSVNAPGRVQKLLSIAAGLGFGFSAHFVSMRGESTLFHETVAQAGIGGYAVGALLGLVRR